MTLWQGMCLTTSVDILTLSSFQRDDCWHNLEKVKHRKVFKFELHVNPWINLYCMLGFKLRDHLGLFYLKTCQNIDV